MADVIFYGSKAQLIAKVARLTRVLSGKEQDDAGIVEPLMERMGLTLLGRIQAGYTAKSEGGIDELGIQWLPLSPVTLALRSRSGDSSKKVLDRLQAAMRHMSSQRKALLAVHYQRLLVLYQSPSRGASTGTKARQHAKSILEKMRPYISKTRYQKIKNEISGPLQRTRAERLALSHAFALILRDTGRLLKSLSPEFRSADTVMRILPGAISVGSNVRTKSGINLLALHDSSAPRKKKKDGTDKLPRRQVLPDSQRPIPQQWWKAMGDAFKNGLSSQELWLRYLGNQARAG